VISDSLLVGTEVGFELVKIRKPRVVVTYRVSLQQDSSYVIELTMVDGVSRLVRGFLTEAEAEIWIADQKRLAAENEVWIRRPLKTWRR
jgi:hypothetical protein